MSNDEEKMEISSIPYESETIIEEKPIEEIKMATTFFPTEVLKQKSERKPIKTKLIEDGRDPSNCWDEIARSLWPATHDQLTDREALANELMWACQDDTVLGAAPTAGIIMSRMAQRMMGNNWMARWLRDNHTVLRHRTAFNRREYGGVSKMFKKFFSRR